ncbi:Mitochondrial pyruvate carrier 3 [Vitis vinifera]|uniref:Mitochondrial pyruvate carrier n=1 Tax=Vitis vinifera TaxID=29760 RepID=A0A438JHL4_VITVI|nr:Mitochondrial pyruvate carrier 3 [Vitis vinifera]
MEDKSGRMLVFCLATLLVFSTFINVGNASGREIGYKSLGVDETNLCGPLHPTSVSLSHPTPTIEAVNQKCAAGLEGSEKYNLKSLEEKEKRDFMAATKLQAFWNHPAGPKTSSKNLDGYFTADLYRKLIMAFSSFFGLGNKMSISIQVGFFTIAVHFWAPTFKWGVSIANIYDFWTPAEQLSYPQQTVHRFPAIAGSGIIWSRRIGTFSVSAGMAATGMYQLGRMMYFPNKRQLWQKNAEEDVQRLIRFVTTLDDCLLE